MGRVWRCRFGRVGFEEICGYKIGSKEFEKDRRVSRRWSRCTSAGALRRHHGGRKDVPRDLHRGSQQTPPSANQQPRTHRFAGLLWPVREHQRRLSAVPRRPARDGRAQRRLGVAGRAESGAHRSARSAQPVAGRQSRTGDPRNWRSHQSASGLCSVCVSESGHAGLRRAKVVVSRFPESIRRHPDRRFARRRTRRHSLCEVQDCRVHSYADACDLYRVVAAAAIGPRALGPRQCARHGPRFTPLGEASAHDSRRNRA